jgi:hypothetical protein
MRLSVPILLSAFLLSPAANLAFAQHDTRSEQRSAIAATPAASTALTATPAAEARHASRPADRGDAPLCFGFLEFDFDCDAPAAHLNPLPQSPAQVAQAAREIGRSGADQAPVR